MMRATALFNKKYMVLVCALALLTNRPSYATSHKTLVLTDSPASESNPDEVFQSLSFSPFASSFLLFDHPPNPMNSRGEYLFYAITKNTVNQIESSIGLWHGGNGKNFEKIVGIGDNAPADNDLGSFDSIRDAAINASGKIIFEANTSDLNNTRFWGMWVSQDGNLNNLFPDNYNIPELELPGASVGSYNLDTLDVLNDSRFPLLVSAPNSIPYELPSAHNMVVSVSGRQIIASIGQPAPGTPSGVAFGTFFSPPVMNSAGLAAFRSSIFGPGVDDTFAHGIWSWSNQQLNLVAYEGMAAPGLNPGTVFTAIDHDPLVDELGRIAFTAELAGGDVNGLNNGGLWVQANGSLQLAIQKGERAPGTPEGVYFDVFDLYDINQNGQILIRGKVRGEGVDFYDFNEYGMWAGDINDLRLIARDGDQAPGLPDGTTFQNLAGINRTPFINHLGQVTFTATVLTKTGLWATDRQGDAHLIALEGQMYNVSQDPLVEDWREIADIGNDAWSSFSSEGPSAISDTGDVLFHLTFTDGSSGLFSASVLKKGDVDGDNDVDDSDLGIAISSFTGPIGFNGGKSLPQGDTDGDGDVDDTDLGVAISAFTGPLPATVPEPGSLAAIALGAAILGRRRHRG